MLARFAAIRKKLIGVPEWQRCPDRFVSARGRVDDGVSQISAEVTLASFTKDTLCVRLHSMHNAPDDRRTHFDAGIEDHYRLFAPDSLRSPDRDVESITATSVIVTAFDARFTKNTYESRGDKIVEEHEYRVDEKFDVCFAPLRQQRGRLPLRLAVREKSRRNCVPLTFCSTRGR